ncbi:MAG: glycoside hydrolase family protein [Syntrophaceae bacterium]|nr:glycoside hydrolase family protein [Syntrophaceae bacterium]
MTEAKELLKRHEGLRLKPYRCTAGRLTIGWGRNLEDKGISRAEADILFENDWAEAEAGARTLVGNWDELSENRKGVLVNMVFNMGLEGMRKWKNTLRCIEQGDFRGAAGHMRQSLWARQVPVRAAELIRIMEEG